MPDAVQAEVDLYEIPMEELERLANQAAVDGQARDEKGRFAKAEEVEETVEEAVEEELEKVFEYEIDLGPDGGGKQVFRASTQEELIEKLGTAQEHASRKIRELSTVKKAEVKDTSDPNEEWLLSQELLTSPAAVIRKQIEKEFGKPLKEVRAELDEVRALRIDREETKKAEGFIKAHPEFIRNDYNRDRIENYLKAHNQNGTGDNIEQAFQVLSQGGLLQLKTDEEEVETTTNTTQRIAAPGVRTVVIQKKATSGLSSKSSVKAPELTTNDLYEMPMDKFLELGGMSKADNW